MKQIPIKLGVGASILLILVIVLIEVFLPLSHVHAQLNLLGALGDVAGGFVLTPISALSGILRSLVTLLFGLVVVLFDWVIGMFQKVPLTTCPPNVACVVDLGWRAMRDIATMFFILILTIVGIFTILQGLDSKYGVRLLPRAFVMFILVHFSKVFVGFFADVSNIVMNFFLRPLADKSLGMYIFHKILGGELFASGGFLGLAGVFSAGRQMTSIVNDILAIIFMFITAFVFFTIAFLFVFRTVAFWILTILSPIAFAASVFPWKYTQDLWGKWLNQLMQWSMVGIFAAAGIWLATLAAGSTAFMFKDVGVGSQQIAGVSSAFSPEGIVQYGVIMLILALVPIIAIQTGATGASFAINWANQTWARTGGRLTWRGVGRASAGLARMGIGGFARERIGPEAERRAREIAEMGARLPGPLARMVERARRPVAEIAEKALDTRAIEERIKRTKTTAEQMLVFNSAGTTAEKLAVLQYLSQNKVLGKLMFDYGKMERVVPAVLQDAIRRNLNQKYIDFVEQSPKFFDPALYYTALGKTLGEEFLPRALGAVGMSDDQIQRIVASRRTPIEVLARRFKPENIQYLNLKDLIDLGLDKEFLQGILARDNPEHLREMARWFSKEMFQHARNYIQNNVDSLGIRTTQYFKRDRTGLWDIKFPTPGAAPAPGGAAPVGEAALPPAEAPLEGAPVTPEAGPAPPPLSPREVEEKLRKIERELAGIPRIRTGEEEAKKTALEDERTKLATLSSLHTELRNLRIERERIERELRRIPVVRTGEEETKHRDLTGQLDNIKREVMRVETELKERQGS